MLALTHIGHCLQLYSAIYLTSVWLYILRAFNGIISVWMQQHMAVYG